MFLSEPDTDNIGNKVAATMQTVCLVYLWWIFWFAKFFLNSAKICETRNKISLTQINLIFCLSPGDDATPGGGGAIP